MTNRLTRPIRKRLKTTGQQTQDSLSDIWSRLTYRLSEMQKRSERLEGHIQKGQAYNAPIDTRITKFGALFSQGMMTNDLIVAAMAELVAVLKDQAEEYSQAQIEMGMIKADMAAQQAEFDRAQKLAVEGRYDAANLETVTREGYRFGQDDSETIKATLIEVNKTKYTQALIDTDEATWQELEAAFEAAREAREI